MSTPATIIETLGIKRIAAHVGVVDTAVMNARKKPLLPCRWYIPLKALCEEEGIDCPPEVFNWSWGSAEAEAAE